MLAELDASGERALATEWLDRPDELVQLAPAWDALCDECPWSTPFLRPGWVLAASDERTPLGLVAVRRGTQLVGALSITPLPDQARTWVIAGTGPSDTLDVVARPECARSVARAALRALTQRSGWDALELHELRETSPLLAAAREGAAGRIVVDDPLSISLAMQWPAGARTLDEVVDPHWARRVRYDLRRAARRGASVEVARGASEASDEALAALLHSHEARWAARGQPGVLAERPTVERALRAMLREDRAQLVSLRFEGALRASYVMLRERDWAGLYLSGFDPAIASLSPLVVLLSTVIERLTAEGVKEIDFLRGVEAYKYHWGVVERVQRRVRIER